MAEWRNGTEWRNGILPQIPNKTVRNEPLAISFSFINNFQSKDGKPWPFFSFRSSYKRWKSETFLYTRHECLEILCTSTASDSVYCLQL